MKNQKSSKDTALKILTAGVLLLVLTTRIEGKYLDGK